LIAKYNGFPSYPLPALSSSRDMVGNPSGTSNFIKSYGLVLGCTSKDLSQSI